MLPQFGYVVAQAGADSLTPSKGALYAGRSTSPPPAVKQEQPADPPRPDPYSRSPPTQSTSSYHGQQQPYMPPPPPPPPPAQAPPTGTVTAAPHASHFMYASPSSSSSTSAANVTASQRDEQPPFYYDQRPANDAYRKSAPWPSTLPPPPSSPPSMHASSSSYMYSPSSSSSNWPPKSRSSPPPAQPPPPLPHHHPPPPHTHPEQSLQHPQLYGSYPYPAAPVYMESMTQPPPFPPQSYPPPPPPPVSYPYPMSHDVYPPGPAPPPAPPSPYYPQQAMSPVPPPPASLSHASPPIRQTRPSPGPPASVTQSQGKPEPSYYQSKQGWQQDDAQGPEPKMLRRLREYNDVMSWMDSDFWDHHEQLYEEKLQTLQKELQSIQDGEHPLFKELVTDLELIRDQAIDDALCFEAYQLSMSRQDHDVNTMLIEEECQTEIDHLNEVLMVVIDEHRKMIKEDRDDIDGIEISNIFTEAYARVKQKRHLRKRAANHNNVDRGSPARVENRGRRQKNAPVVHSIHAPLTTKEEDEVESDLLMMKGVSTKRGAPARR